jgi:hypothetical protein
LKAFVLVEEVVHVFLCFFKEFAAPFSHDVDNEIGFIVLLRDEFLDRGRGMEYFSADGKLFHRSQALRAGDFGDELHPALEGDVVGDWTEVHSHRES